MKIAFWNIRGLNQASKQKEVRELIKEECLSICCVLETHLNKRKLDNVAVKTLGEWDWLSNSNKCDRGCRILIGWDKKIVNLMVIDRSDQAILCYIETIEGGKKFYCSIVYAETKGK